LGGGSKWLEAARRTPETRNRYADALRAASICVVVVGHWVMAAPTVESGVGFTLSDILRVAPWTQWLTWVFQVMPIFFAVGGYANAASWESARRDGVGYDAWVARRLQRLVRPVAPFLLVWCLLGLSARWLGLGVHIVLSGSRAAFVPMWFLSVYVMVVVSAPAMHSLWRRFGLTSFWALVVGAAGVDAATRLTGIEGVPWLNFIFVWLAIHQLGFAWRGGAFSDPSRALALALAGLAALIVLEGLASYPVSMVTVPGGTPANSTPPTLALLALGVTHVGVALAMEPRLRAWLERLRLWTVVVVINGVILTLYLWHTTVMVLLVGLAELMGGLGLRSLPGTATWWAFRIPWVTVLLIGLAGFVGVFGRVEARRVGRAAVLPAWRSIAGAIALCVGLVALAAEGIGADNPVGVRLWPVLLALSGMLLVIVTVDDHGQPQAGGSCQPEAGS
jgi:hypothetical protein